MPDTPNADPDSDPVDVPYERELTAETEIAASPASVWALVGDVTRMCDWSPQVTSTRLSDGAAGCAPGVRFTNRNVDGEQVWTTHAEILAYEPDSELAFRVKENYVVWRFLLSGTPTGTRLVQRRETPDGISELSLQWTEENLGGQAAFTETMRAGMRQTLEAIKTEAEGG